MSRRNPGLATSRGSALQVRGLLRSDTALLRSAVDVLADGERPLAMAAAREDLAGVVSRAGEGQEAITQLESAYAAYVEAGASRDTARVRAALRLLGVRKRQPRVVRTGHGWEGLTKSESIVVDLVARGMTNREAASELFLSPDTINAHLKHAFAKLGIRSRVQLARLAADRERAAVEPTRVR